MVETAELCGFKVNPKKTEGPKRVLEFLGVELNTISCQMRITENRLNEIREELHEWSEKKVCTKREILSILGILQFCARVVIHGNKFVRRIITLSKAGRHLSSKLRINKDTRKDFMWWSKCMGCHNGLGWFNKTFDYKLATLVFTDASDNAMAGVVSKKWTMVVFEGQYSWMKDSSIVWRELAAVVLT